MYRILFFLALLFVNYSYSQENQFPQNAKLSPEFKNSIEKQKVDFYRILRADSVEVKNYSIEFVLDKIDNSKEYRYLFEAEYWIAFNYEKIIPELIERITNKKEIGLQNSADLIIDERIQSGDLEFYGHGGVSNDDLFTISGRANRLLTIVTGEDFGHVSMYSTPAELEQLQNKWIRC